MIKIDDKAYLSVADRWPNYRNIAVCWEKLPSDAGSVANRVLVETSVKSTWLAVKGVGLGVTFSPSPCVQGAPGIHIRVADEMENTVGLGTELDKVEGGLVFNFTFNRWKPDCPVETERTRCIRVLAVHEFGHAFGFAHEHNRNDTPDTCRVMPGGPYGDMQLNEYDRDSIMNYCNTKNTGTLSDGDRKGILYLYPAGEK